MFQDRLLALLVAVWAKPMVWLAAVHRWLQGVGESSLPSVLQFVALMLCGPVFQCYNLLFKLSYSLGAIRLRRVCRRQRLLGVQNVLSERELDLIDSSALRGDIESLNDAKCRFEALVSGLAKPPQIAL